jgi:hypothetical protein
MYIQRGVGILRERVISWEFWNGMERLCHGAYDDKGLELHVRSKRGRDVIDRQTDTDRTGHDGTCMKDIDRARCKMECFRMKLKLKMHV